MSSSDDVLPLDEDSHDAEVIAANPLNPNAAREALDMEEPENTGCQKTGWRMTAIDAVILTVMVFGLTITSVYLIHNYSLCKAELAKRMNCRGPLGPDGKIPPRGASVSSSSSLTPSSRKKIPTNDSKKSMTVRLPRSIVPDSYVLNIVPHIWEGNFTFYSMVKIIVNVTADTNNVTLHAVAMNIEEKHTKVSELSTNDLSNMTRDIKIIDQAINEETQFFTIKMSEYLRTGKQYLVQIKYLGIHDNLRRGFYGISYSVGNETRWIATTDLHPVDARRAFPCFDEPALKATFQINVARPRNMTTLSNMPKMGEPQPFPGVSDYAWDRYEPSPPMSTYVVAFLIIDFDVMKSSDGKFALWARHEMIEKTRFSLQIGPKILKFYEDYFQMKFPLPKLDMVALPNFLPTAMENWGLLTFRETALFYERGVSVSSSELIIATYIAAELAQQWFGNLVTVSWWDDIWLGHAFTTYFSYVAMNSIEADWKALEQFIVHELQDSMTQDQGESTHSLAVKVNDPKHVDFLYDKLTFGKGASIIRMIDHSLTTKVFKQGLTNYLKENAYKSATENDLWDALTKQARKDGVIGDNFTVKQIMDTWTRQSGLPILTITRNYETGSAEIVQERFAVKKSTTNGTAANSKTLWWIPITYTTEVDRDFGRTKPSKWLKAKRSIKLENIGASRHQWVIFNVQQTGYYRVNYDDANWKLITRHLKSPDYGDIATINRAQLIDDSMQLARAGHLNYSIALGITTYLAQETEYIPWSAAFTELSYINDMFIKYPDFDKFRTYVSKLMTRVYAKTGFEENVDDSQLEKFTRIEITAWACAMHVKDCIDRAVKLFSDWQNSPDPDKNNPISPNLRYEVYCTGIRRGDFVEWDFAWERYKNSNENSERATLLYALGCTRETWLIGRYLEWTFFKNSGLRESDISDVYNSVSKNAIGQPMVFNFMRDNWDRLMKRFNGSNTVLKDIVSSATWGITTKVELQDLLGFVSKKGENLGVYIETIQESVKHAKINLQWLDRNYATVRDWLEKHA